MNRRSSLRSTWPWALTASFAIAFTAQTAQAAPADREACFTSYEQGQKLRQQAKLREAREQLQICARMECPAMVQRECTQWLTEVSSALPTVTFSVQDEQGRDIIDVQVSVDGKNILQHLDGKTTPVDPGVHTFRFEAEGKAPVEERVLLSEGDKAKKVAVVLKAAGSGTGTGTGTGTGDPPPATGTPKNPGGGHTIWPWITMGTGVAVSGVGLVLFVTGHGDFPAECTLGTGECNIPSTKTKAEADEITNRAKGADNRIRLGTVLMIGGAVVAVGGFVWFLLEPTGPKKKPAPKPDAVRIEPRLGVGYLGLGGTF